MGWTLTISMLCEPADDAPAEDWAPYGVQVDEARARGGSLILGVPMKASERPASEKE
ncbi:MAG TPA: hypothetical protein PLO14_11685 [Accumulibacter sp.]|uniref:hypothetical protein n=1 Tax=Accumulibacter sp. TaxID=2053492 RepID=UPI0025F88D39|nr:hypothetical protein [Accumulibacter sp.]MCM8597481.1 hypothetical protein [Accumulibacter sp.]MCM8661735.1 hypothetical protein [Accumulibacter sp.]HNC52883.1 hypothetical protein [Accumulibacter sp.]